MTAYSRCGGDPKSHSQRKPSNTLACDTGVGPVGQAGVANIVNAFIEAGAQSVVSTLLANRGRRHPNPSRRVFFTLIGVTTRANRSAEAGRASNVSEIWCASLYWVSLELVGQPVGGFKDKSTTYVILVLTDKKKSLSLTQRHGLLPLGGVLTTLHKRFYYQSPERLNDDWRASVERHRLVIRSSCLFGGQFC